MSTGSTQAPAAPRLSHSFADLAERLTVAGHEHQVGAGARGAEGDRAADAARRARHHQDGRGSVHGLSTTFTQPSFFCWNIS